jgi:uroporphyrinogen decarboxylase
LPNSSGPFLRALNGEAVNPPPIWLMRQAGRYLPEYRAVREKVPSFLDLCLDPDLAAEVTLQPIRRFGFDAAIIFSDILIVPHALGQHVAFLQAEGPKLEPVTDAASLAKLDADAAQGRLAPVFTAIDRVRADLPAETALIGFCGAPWTVATYMVGGSGSKDQADARRMAYADRETFKRLIDLLVDISADYLLRQIKAGADAVQIFDSWSGSLPEDEFSAWCIGPTRDIVGRVKAEAPEIPIIGFPKGCGVLAEIYASETGIDAIGCDTNQPLAYIRDRLQTVLPVQGNLDPMLLLAGGDMLDRRISEILASLAGAPFVFNLGHGIHPDTPPEHVESLVHRVRQAGGHEEAAS